jgi:hypothetical protein
MSDVPFFADQLARTLSQGDLVGELPWGVFPDPLQFGRPNGKPNELRVHTPLDVKNAFQAPEKVLVPSKRTVGIVLWDDCQIDKLMNQNRPKEQWFVAVAPLLPISVLNEKDRPLALAGEVRRLFPVPKDEVVGVEDSVVDLRHIVPVKYSLLESKRLASLSSSMKKALHEHLFVFLTSTVIPRNCSGCGAPIKFDAANE